MNNEINIQYKKSYTIYPNQITLPQLLQIRLTLS